jgi:hypothetical protein
VTRRRRNKYPAELRFARLDDPLARLMAIVELPWFVDWWRGLTTGKINCLHCGRSCGAGDVGMTGAVRIDRRQMLTVTVCADCYDRSPAFEDAGRAAVAAAEAGLLCKGRSFTHGVAAPEAVQ